jgi:gas vesicle protein
MVRDNENAMNLLWFVAGAAIGAGIAILFAPASGSELRRRIGERAGQSGRDLLNRGRDLYERGRHTADEAADMYERGRQMIEERETSSGQGPGSLPVSEPGPLGV